MAEKTGAPHHSRQEPADAYLCGWCREHPDADVLDCRSSACLNWERWLSETRTPDDAADLRDVIEMLALDAMESAADHSDDYEMRRGREPRWATWDDDPNADRVGGTPDLRRSLVETFSLDHEADGEMVARIINRAARDVINDRAERYPMRALA